MLLMFCLLQVPACWVMQNKFIQLTYMLKNGYLEAVVCPKNF